MSYNKGVTVPQHNQLSEPLYEERHRVDAIGENLLVQSMFAAQNEAIDMSANFRSKLEGTFKKKVSSIANKLARKAGMNSVDINMDQPVVLEMDKNNGLTDHSLVQFTATITNPRRKELH